MPLPYFLAGKQNKARKEFYHKIFNVNSKISDKFYSEKAYESSLLNLDETAEKEIDFGNYIAMWITRIQYIMIKQDQETQTYIVNSAVNILIDILKGIFKRAYPEDKEEGYEEYWIYIENALKDSFLTDYNEAIVKDYMESLHFFNCLNYQKHPYIVPNFLGRINKVADGLGLSEKAKSITDDVRMDSLDNVLKTYNEITEPNIPYTSALILMGLGTAIWYTGLPYANYIAGAIGLYDALSTSVHAFARRKLTKEVKQYFLSKGRETYFNKTGERIQNGYWNTEASVLIGINSVCYKLSKSRQLTKKMVSSTEPGKPAHEVYVSSYEDFPHLSDITDTQRKKIRPKKPVNTTNIHKIIEKEPNNFRKIELPINFKSKLIECENHSLISIQPPTAASKIAPEELNDMMGPRGDIVAKKFGQSGVKIMIT